MKPRSQKLRHQETKKPRNQETNQFSSQGIPITPQQSDSHPCTSPPLEGHEGTFGFVSILYNPYTKVSGFIQLVTCLRRQGRIPGCLQVALVFRHNQNTTKAAMVNGAGAVSLSATKGVAADTLDQEKKLLARRSAGAMLSRRAQQTSIEGGTVDGIVAGKCTSETQ